MHKPLTMAREFMRRAAFSSSFALAAMLSPFFWPFFRGDRPEHSSGDANRLRIQPAPATSRIILMPTRQRQHETSSAAP